MFNEPIQIHSTRISADSTCPRSRYWSYEADGTGYEPPDTGIELFIGTTVHDCIAAIINNSAPIDTIADAANKQVFDALLQGLEHDDDSINYAHEQATLVEGMVRGFDKHVWPILSKLYPKVVAIEHECKYDKDGISFIRRPDCLAEDTEGNLCYLEWKTSSSKNDKWIASWSTAVQLHATVRAVEQTFGRPVQHVQVIGLYKGYNGFGGKNNSPFTHIYRSEASPPFVKEMLSYEYRKGLRKFPVWELNGGQKRNIEGMPANVLADQFPMTAPIYVNDDLIEAWIRQSALREREVIMAKSLAESPDLQQIVMDGTFPQRFDKCVPAWGRACQFRNLCFGRADANPLQMGYTVRQTREEKEARADA